MSKYDQTFERAVFDLETAPIDGVQAFLEEPTAPDNYKRPEAIAAYIADAKVKQIERAALDPDLCRVVAVGALIEGGEPLALTTEHNSEEDMLALFWDTVGARHLVCFNGLNFDLPVLIRRAQYLGLKVPSVAIDKYRHPGVTDLQMVLSFNGAKTFRSLGFYCKRFGIDVPDTLSGADIGAAVNKGRWDDVRGHVLADVAKTGQLAARLGHFRLDSEGVF